MLCIVSNSFSVSQLLILISQSQVQLCSSYKRLIYLRQCVMEVFCSTSTERSRKSSSLLLICRENGHQNKTKATKPKYQINVCKISLEYNNDFLLWCEGCGRKAVEILLYAILVHLLKTLFAHRLTQPKIQVY